MSRIRIASNNRARRRGRIAAGSLGSRNRRLSGRGGPGRVRPIGGISMVFRSRRYYRLMQSYSRRIGPPPSENTVCPASFRGSESHKPPSDGRRILSRIVIIVLNERPTDSCHLPTPTCNERSFISLVQRTCISNCSGMMHSCAENGLCA